MHLTSIIPLLIWVSSQTDPHIDSLPDTFYQSPRNVVLVIADGMGLPQVAAMVRSSGETAQIERFPITGLQKTHSSTHLNTDSGASATAMGCGVKTYNNAVGLGPDTLPRTNLFELAEQKGMATGLVVSSSLVHATPAGFIAHQVFRGFQEAIAVDIFESGIDYIVGGGGRYFTHRYSDDRNLLEEFEDKGYHVDHFRQKSFKQFARSRSGQAVYITAHAEPQKRHEGRLYLPYACADALAALENQSDTGFFLLIEASQIDFAGHQNDSEYLFAELNDFNECLRQITDFAVTNRETLVIVTADHGTGGLAILPGKPERRRPKLRFHSRRHVADMIPVFALGPGAEFFGGIYENTDIFEKIRRVAGF